MIDSMTEIYLVIFGMLAIMGVLFVIFLISIGVEDWVYKYKYAEIERLRRLNEERMNSRELDNQIELYMRNIGYSGCYGVAEPIRIRVVKSENSKAIDKAKSLISKEESEKL